MFLSILALSSSNHSADSTAHQVIFFRTFRLLLEIMVYVDGKLSHKAPFLSLKKLQSFHFLSSRDAELPFRLSLLGLDIVIITRQVGSPLLQHSQCRTDVSPDHSFYTTASFTSSMILFPGHPHALPPLAAQAPVCPLLSESQRSCRHGG